MVKAVHAKWWRLLCCLLVGSTVLSLPLALSIARTPAKPDDLIVVCGPAHVPTQEEVQDEALARQTGADYVLGNLQLSLEMREKVDFLLTPAFLVQQAISEGVVLTYPEE